MFVANVKMLQLTHILIYNRVWNYNCTFVFQAFGPIVKHQHYCENTVYSLCKNVSCGVVPPSLRFGNFLHYCDIHGTLLLQIIGPLHQETIPDSGQERRQSQDGWWQRWPWPAAAEGDLRGGTWHMHMLINVYPFKLESWNFVCVISGRNLHLFNPIGPLQAKLVILVILFAGCCCP